MSNTNSSKKPRPFQQWMIGFAVTFLALIILFGVLIRWIEITFIIVGVSLLSWGGYEAYRGRPFILLGIISTPFILGFVFFIICGGFLIFSL
ncbi:hypothetical protein COE15_09025 [Bacillus cereus]|uniref:hypothetical protein n=1 Tax=unclassified Bacillus (in: firmicutes) TaxID=185979 RepID=UPI000479C8FA|nr:MULTISPECIES: hypothetical protein [unclassified Bacillus (in: firmicutes)]PFD96713.1 hypothetical protein CN288_23880 [Bacillus sp. AFS023182]PGY02330.1 hypothetical protein COE15_09025 [Bacillus cereus]